MKASYFEHTATVQVLVDAGADKEAKDNVRDWESDGESNAYTHSCVRVKVWKLLWCAVLHVISSLYAVTHTFFSHLPILTLLSSVVSPELYLGSSFFLHGASFSRLVYSLAAQRSWRPRKISTPQLCRSWWMRALTRRRRTMWAIKGAREKVTRIHIHVVESKCGNICAFSQMCCTTCAFVSLTHSNTCINFSHLPIHTLLSSVVSPVLYLGSSFFLHGASLLTHVELCTARPHSAH